MSETDACQQCGGRLELIDVRRHVFQPDYSTMTDGQLAEQHAAEMGGPFEEGIHGGTERVHQCSSCGYQRVRSDR